MFGVLEGGKPVSGWVVLVLGKMRLGSATETSLPAHLKYQAKTVKNVF